MDPDAPYPRRTALPEPPEDPDDHSVRLGLMPYHGIAPALNELQEASDRVSAEVVGTSVQGRDMYLVTVTEPENRAESDHQRRMRELISQDPARAARDRTLPDRYKAPVLVNANIHGNEWEGTDASLRVIEELATGTDEATEELLESTRLYFVVRHLRMEPRAAVGGAGRRPPHRGRGRHRARGGGRPSGRVDEAGGHGWELALDDGAQAAALNALLADGVEVAWSGRGGVLVPASAAGAVERVSDRHGAVFAEALSAPTVAVAGAADELFTLDRMGFDVEPVSTRVLNDGFDWTGVDVLYVSSWLVHADLDAEARADLDAFLEHGGVVGRGPTGARFNDQAGLLDVVRHAGRPDANGVVAVTAGDGVLAGTGGHSFVYSPGWFTDLGEDVSVEQSYAAEGRSWPGTGVPTRTGGRPGRRRWTGLRGQRCRGAGRVRGAVRHRAAVPQPPQGPLRAGRPGPLLELALESWSGSLAADSLFLEQIDPGNEVSGTAVPNRSPRSGHVVDGGSAGGRGGLRRTPGRRGRPGPRSSRRAGPWQPIPCSWSRSTRATRSPGPLWWTCRREPGSPRSR
ncbi:hypothetical protein HFP72_00790 [Nocardiopsis sp. ARC36]